MSVISSLVSEENSFRIRYSNFSQTARVAAGYRTILRETFAEDLQNELDRSHMNISLFPSLLSSLRSPHYRDKNFYSLTSGKLQPERNTIEASDFYFTLLVLRLFIATCQTYSNRMDTLRLTTGIFLAGRNYVLHPAVANIPVRWNALEIHRLQKRIQFLRRK